MAFDKYIGLAAFYYNNAKQPIVPIFRLIRKFFRGNVAYIRTQFLLNIAFAVIVHKVQKVTLKQAVFNIFGTKFTASLNYIGVSKVKSKEGLLFNTPFNYNTI